MIGAAQTHRAEDGLRVSAEAILACRADALFGVLADPALHPEIDGGANVAAAVDPSPLTAADQQFRMDLANGFRVLEPTRLAASIRRLAELAARRA